MAGVSFGEEEYDSSFESKYDESFESEEESITDGPALIEVGSRQASFEGYPVEKSAFEDFIQTSIKHVKKNAFRSPKKKISAIIETRDSQECDAFCKRLINMMKKERTKMNERPKELGANDKNEGPVLSHFPWAFQLEKMKAENFNRYLGKIGEITKAKTRSEDEQIFMRQAEFLRRKIKIINDKKVEERYIKHITEKTPAMMLSEIIQSSVNPLASHDQVWRELMKPLTLVNKNRMVKEEDKPIYTIKSRGYYSKSP